MWAEIYTRETELSWNFPPKRIREMKMSRDEFRSHIQLTYERRNIDKFSIPYTVTHRTNETKMKMFYSIIFPFFSKIYKILCINYVQPNFPFPLTLIVVASHQKILSVDKRNAKSRKKGQIFIWKSLLTFFCICDFLKRLQREIFLLFCLGFSSLLMQSRAKCLPFTFWKRKVYKTTYLSN